MDFPKLQIQTTPAKLVTTAEKPIQQIEQPKADMDIQQPAAILEISTTRPVLSIDTTEARAEIDLKSVFRRTAEWAQLGRQGGLDGVGRRAAEGRQLMEIEKGGGAIPAIAKQNSSPPPAPLGIRFVGNRSGVKMSITPGTTTIQATPQKPIINVQVNKPIHTYIPGKVSGYMEQYSSIQIDWKA